MGEVVANASTKARCGAGIISRSRRRTAHSCVHWGSQRRSVHSRFPARQVKPGETQRGGEDRAEQDPKLRLLD